MTEPRPAPYPADTRAKGWRFELDYERIEQSSTWALAGPEGRPWLLMMWLVSWRQTPAGSFPNEDDVIVALIGIPEKTWAKHRKVLMRGWWLADDGRLYHDTIASRVRAMLDKKTDAKVRKAEYRQRMDAIRTGASVPTLSHGTDAGQHGDEHGKDITGTRTGTRTYTQEDKPLGKARKRASAFDPASIELPEWIEPEDWQRWCADRAVRRKPVTEQGAAAQLRQLDGYRRQGHSPASVIEHSIAGGFQGLYPPDKAKTAKPAMTTADRNAEAARLLGFGASNA